MTKLIIICGLPGTGKTTLARELSEKLSAPVLHKDSIKEALYEIQNLSTLKDSRRIGLHAIKLLYKLAEEQLGNGLDIIIEAPFYIEEDYRLFRKWKEKYELKIFSVICVVDEKKRTMRLTRRQRHKAHHDSERKLSDFGNELSKVYIKLPGKIITIRTDRPVENLVREISDKLI